MSEDLSTDQSSRMQIEDPPEYYILNDEKHFDLQSWIEFTQLKCIKEYKDEDLEAFKRPFQAGWKRELSIRAQLHSSGKRIVDIFYISPSNQARLKSYVELGFYLKNDQDCKLEPENFTFAKQPIYKYPEEIIKQQLKTAKQIKAEQVKAEQIQIKFTGQQHQQQNGALVQMPQLTPLNINDSDNFNRSEDADSLNNSFNNSVAEGRTKRKRTAPTRFDDEIYLEQTLSIKKKPLVKSPVTPTIKISKLNLSPFSPKTANRTKEEIYNLARQETLTTINYENKEESNSSFKSSKSNKSSKSDHKHSNIQLDANSNVLLNNNSEMIDSNLKELEDGDSNQSNKKDENSQDHLQNQHQQPNETNTTSTSTAIKKSKSKRKSSKAAASAANNSNVDLSATNALLNNSLFMETYNALEMNNLLQNGNFECEDNDLSDCEFVIDAKDSDLTLPLPPCSLICAGRKGYFPSLLCSKCLCLFHPQCAKNGVFLKDTSQFVCPNCIQPTDQTNAIEDSTRLFEQADDLADEDTTNQQLAINQSFLNNNNSSNIKDKLSINQKTANLTAASAAKIPPPKMQNFIPNNHSKMNGLENNLKKKIQHHPSSQLRLPPQLTRNNSNLNNLNSNQQQHSNNSKQRMNFEQQMRFNQQQQQLKQNHFNAQLSKKLNQYNSQQQNLLNLRTSLNQLTNGTHSNSSFASRKTHLDNMNKSLLSSQQLLESFKKVTMNHQAATALASSSSSLLFQQQQQHVPSNRSLLMNRNLRNESTAARFTQQQQQNQQPKATNQQQQTFNANEIKFLNYLNEKQNGFKRMIDQYEALDKIFDHLTVRDLNQCKLVNKTFNRLANERHHWKRLNLKNLIVKDWNYFSTEIVEANQAEELCLEGLRLPIRSLDEQQECSLEDDLWCNFKSCSKYYQSLAKINFGRISQQHLNYLLTNEINEFNPLFDLEHLSIRNLYDAQSADGNLVSLKFLVDKINEFKNLKCLRIESKQGISNDELTINLLNSLSSALPQLQSLYLPSLKGFTIENFEFLTKFTRLECLEIGSCESWTLSENANQEEEDEENEQQETLNNEENRMADDEELRNENQENEFNEFQQQKRSSPSIKKHQGAFKYLSQLRNLKRLYLTDVIIDEMSNQLPLVIEKMCNLESLELGYVTVSPDATQTINILCNTLKTKLPNLKRFSISTDDAHTNTNVFNLLLKRLDNLEELTWKVHTQVEDDGNCLVAFAKERNLESDFENEDNLDLTINNDCIEMIETCFLNDVLQKSLNKTKVFLIPQ